ncbi:MAG: hypothetical protein ACKOCQ_06480, partial [Candidatus Nitrosotenuis sp.]
MNNEIGRKITSLTLMTIMLAAGFTAFAPSTMPEAAAANANLYVSAESSQFQNSFAGPMVIEVIVLDDDINETGEAKGEPDVTINGNKLRMAQMQDGNWYAYFADRAQAQLADSTVGAITTANATGLDFGEFCGRSSNVLGVSFTQTVGFAIATNASGGTQGETTISDSQCSSINIQSGAGRNADDLNNVVRENKTLNRNSAVPIGQIGFSAVAASKAWPVIQLYNFADGGDVKVQYNKGGPEQSVTLKYANFDQLAKLDLDRTTYPRSAQVHATITDMQLNIDPTDEDSWLFGTSESNATTFYQAFDENGAVAGDGLLTTEFTTERTDLMFGDNGILKMNVDKQGSGTNVLLIQDNADSRIISGGSASTARSSSVGATQPVVITESAPNSGVFGTYDESDVSILKTTSNAKRGTSATIDYNDTPKSLVIGLGFASLNTQLADAEWNSGEKLTVTLTDSDANKNSRVDEDLKVKTGSVSLIPSMKIGTPFTLGENGTETDDSIRAKTFASFSLSRAARAGGVGGPIYSNQSMT